MWLGPPFIIRKMTLFTGVRKWGGFGARGPGVGCWALGVGCWALAWRAKKPSVESMAASAAPVKPPPISQTNSRRVCPQGKRFAPFLLLLSIIILPQF